MKNRFRGNFCGLLLHLLGKPLYNTVIRWNDDGTCIVVHKTRRFMDILKLYLNTNKYSSFRRQLNYYGFTMAASKGLEHHFHHPNFCSTGFVKTNRKRKSEEPNLLPITAPKKQRIQTTEAIVEDVFAAVDFKLLDNLETAEMALTWQDIYRLEQKCTQ
jgi:hypothetical protein